MVYINESSVPSVVEGQYNLTHIAESKSNGHNQNMYYVYMIKNASNKLYTGISSNLPKRIYYHNTKQGAVFTKSQVELGDKFKIVFYEEYTTLAEARKREIQIKKWRREKKENLIKRFNSRLPTKNRSEK